MDKTKYAYMNIFDNNYWKFFLIWYHHFLKTEPKYPLFVIGLSEFSDNQRDFFKKNNIYFRTISTTNYNKVYSKVQLADLYRSILKYYFRFIDQYLYCDLDLLLLKNIDHLFNLPQCDFAMASDYWRDLSFYRNNGILLDNNPYYNIGLLLIRKNIFRKLLMVMNEKKKEWDFSHWCFGEWCWNYLINREKYNVFQLTKEYNWHYHLDIEREFTLDDLFVYHYSSPKGKVEMLNRFKDLYS